MHIPFLRAPLTKADIEAAVTVMETSSLTAGKETEHFEDTFADYIGTKYAIAVNSGTSALDLIFKALILMGKLRPGDQVLLPSFTFVACANVLVNNGLKPVFIDIAAHDLNMEVFSNCFDAEIKAVLAVHTFGRPANIYAIKKFTDDHDIPFIEDCAESVGASYNCHKIGSYGIAGAFSFIATKGMTCGEGGMITTDHWELAMIARELRAHGTMQGRHIQGTNVYYQDVIRPGCNYRMTEFQAAIGRSQSRSLGFNNNARRKNTEYLNLGLKDCDWPLTTFPAESQNQEYALSMYSFTLPKGYEQEARDEVLRRICHTGVDARTYFNTPIHRFTYYRSGLKKGSLTTTTNVCNRIITLPCYPSLIQDELDFMIEAVKGACK